jgi:hypothetical protein
MTVSMADIPVLHSTDVAHLYPQVVLPICHRVDRTPYTSSKEVRQCRRFGPARTVNRPVNLLLRAPAQMG